MKRLLSPSFGECAAPEDLTAYFNLRACPGPKDRDRDPNSFFVLAYDDERNVAGGMRCTLVTSGERPLHTETRTGIDFSRRIQERFKIALSGRKAAEFASVVIDTDHRGSNLIKRLYLESTRSLVRHGADIVFAAPYYPNDHLIQRTLAANGYTVYSIGYTEVADDNVKAGRKKNILAVPIAPDLKTSFQNAPCLISAQDCALCAVEGFRLLPDPRLK